MVIPKRRSTVSPPVNSNSFLDYCRVHDISRRRRASRYQCCRRRVHRAGVPLRSPLVGMSAEGRTQRLGSLFSLKGCM